MASFFSPSGLALRVITQYPLLLLPWKEYQRGSPYEWMNRAWASTLGAIVVVSIIVLVEIACLLQIISPVIAIGIMIPLYFGYGLLMWARTRVQFATHYGK